MNINFQTDGLIPVITQDYKTKAVLMLAYMNQEAYDKTVETGKVHYFSRKRKSLWLKGETSGHFQYVKQILFDCDEDSLLILVEQAGVACHTGNFSCFYRNNDGNEVHPQKFIIDEVYEVIENRKANPINGSYTNYLFDKGLDKMLKKVGEETAEVIIASKNLSKEEMTYEISDLMYHLNVLMVQSGLRWDDIYNELQTRKK